MDFSTLRTVHALHRPHFFAPLGNAPHLTSLGIPPSHIHILDWWEDAAITVPLSPAEQGATTAPVKGPFVLTCTPSQHTSNRGAFDRAHTLWASWAVSEELPAEASESEPKRAPRKVYFGGDTGYRTVFESEDEDAVPRCPAFREIGERFGEFDLALLPIGCVRGSDLCEEKEG